MEDFSEIVNNLQLLPSQHLHVGIYKLTIETIEQGVKYVQS